MTETHPPLHQLFTTIPLTRPHIPSTISPTDKRFSTTRRATIDDDKVISPVDSLSFDKIAIPRRNTEQGYISKVSLDRLSCSSTACDETRSPSLISCLFQAGRSRHSSSSGFSRQTPLTPLSTSPAQGCRPILRRPTASSTWTSASEDNGVSGRGFGGRGLTPLDKAYEAAGRERRECTIKFVVEPFRTASIGNLNQAACSNRIHDASRSVTGSSARASLYPSARSPQFRATWWDSAEHPTGADGYSSDDEGYHEDEEGGFSSDEELFETIAGWSRTSWTYTPRVPFTAPAADGDHEVDSGESSSQEEIPLVHRGRKVKIASNKKQICSRHRSPPPRPYPPDLPVPAARSPSAAFLLQRRQAT